MDTKLSSWCDGLIEAGWLAAIVVTPLFFNIHSSRVFEPDKLTLLRSIAVIMLAAWLVKFIELRGWRSMTWMSWRSESSIWRMPFVIPVFLLSTVYLLSTLLSINPIVSWAGSYQRLQGTYTTMAYITIFALMLATIRGRDQVSRVITTAIIVSIPVSLYAMLQHFGLDPLPWGGNVQVRVAGHMGNSIFIAAFLIMVVPITLARIIDAFTSILHDDELATSDVVRSSIYIFALSIQMIAIFWSRSRGPFMGLAASAFTFVLILLVTLRNYSPTRGRLTGVELGRAFLLVGLGAIVPFLVAIFILADRVDTFTSFAFFVGMVALLIVAILVLALARRAWRWLWLSWILLAVSLAGILVIFNFSQDGSDLDQDSEMTRSLVSALSSWRDLPEIGRFGSLLESDSGTGLVRVLIWEGVLDLIAPHEPLQSPIDPVDPFNILRPVVGYGPETMYVAYNRFYPPQLATVEARNASPDRSHNETFDAVVITGALGFTAWQLVYISVFYYGFRWLGVVGSKTDRNILIGLWIGGGVASGIIVSILAGAPFAGVAIPAGTIAGLILYLVYYALKGRGGEDLANSDPFGVDRLMMIALVSAVLAHYVEIHFGIAIAATRTYFFVYIACLFMIGYFLPRLSAQEIQQAERSSGRKKGRVRDSSKKSRAWLGPVLSSALILALIIGVLGYNYITYSLPPGETIEVISDVPSTGEIFRQSFFINASQGFVESPFLFMLLVLTWILGALLSFSELVKQGRIKRLIDGGKIAANRIRTSTFIFIALFLGSTGVFLLSVVSRITGPSVGFFGYGFMQDLLLFIWSMLCLLAAVRLLQGTPSARNTAGIVASIGLIGSIPMIAAGIPLFGLAMVVSCAVVLYLLWHASWSGSLLPGLLLALLSLALGLLYAYFHAFQVRNGILPPPGATESTPVLIRRVLEADQAITLLSTFYIFLFTVLAITGMSLAIAKISNEKKWGSYVGFGAATLIFIGAFYLVGSTNLRVIQADIVYKRADPWDKQATRSGNTDHWDNAIALYQHAIDLTPTEDFYYLWLGRAYLERSSVTEDPGERVALLDTAESRLQQAQKINPLNTDHTANLARLNTRWAEFSDGDSRQTRLSRASDYYESAMSLSPQNAVIINEYARLAFAMGDDCDEALRLIEKSVDTDPFFTVTYFDRAELYSACGSQLEGEPRDELYRQSTASLEEGLNREPENGRRWLQLAEVYIRLNETDNAVAAYENAIATENDNLPLWQVDFTMAQWFSGEDSFDNATLFAARALDNAPPEAVEQIQEFLAAVAGNS